MCAERLYVGTEAGATQYPPLTIGRCAIVAENHGAHDGSLRCVWLDAQGLPEEVAAQLSIAGRIAAAPVVIDNYVIVVDDAGTLFSFEVTGNRDAPLKKMFEVRAKGRAAAASQLVAAGNQCWGGRRGPAALRVPERTLQPARHTLRWRPFRSVANAGRRDPPLRPPCAGEARRNRGRHFARRRNELGNRIGRRAPGLAQCGR